MRQLSEIELKRLQALTREKVEVTLIEPTETGLKKCIMDATGPVRTYLLEKEIHNYDDQKKGPTNKVLTRATLVRSFDTESSIASFYRPQTKNGDPRIWFRKLGSFAKPNELIAILAYQRHLYVFNLTQLDIEHLLKVSIDNPLKELIFHINRSLSENALELLSKLKLIAARGPIPTSLKADTSVGRTLESLLGIRINSSKNPDYKGIELKSFREARPNRKTLFAQVPDWSLSYLKSSAEILNHYGYQRGKNFKLYCTVSVRCENSQGLRLRIENKTNVLAEFSVSAPEINFAVWRLPVLHKRLQEKHNETFWISAESRIIDGTEHLLYKKVEHTQRPITTQFDLLLDQGLITMDHLIKRTENGKVVEKGPLFKIKPSSLSTLFPPSKTYDLL